MLRSLVHSAQRGRGAVAFVTGEAGMGKSRLAKDVERYAADAGLRVLHGRCTTSGEHFAALRQAVFAVLRREDPPDDPKFGPYQAALSRLAPDWRAEQPTEDSPVLIAEALLRLLSHLAGERGCLLVLEDLQDADAGTLSVIDYLADNLEHEPVLALCTIRSEAGPALLLAMSAMLRRAATTVELGPLDDESVRQLVACCMGVSTEGVRGPLLERLQRESGGIPLYVEALLGDQGESNLLDRRVPQAIVVSVTERVGRLGPRCRRVLEVAAALGTHFHASVVGATLDLPDDELLRQLRKAVDAQLVSPREGHDSYSFRRELTARAICTDLLPGELAKLSREAARAVERMFPELPGDWCVRTAELWLTAGETGRSTELFDLAGRRALDRGEVLTAVELLDRGLAAIESSDLVPDAVVAGLIERLLGLLVLAGQIGRVSDLATRFDSRIPLERKPFVRLQLARAAAVAGHWQDGLRQIESIRESLRTGASPALLATVDVVAAQLAFGNPAPDRIPTAERLATRALRTAENALLPSVACEALEVLGRCALQQDLESADALYERAFSIAEEHNLTASRVRSLYRLGTYDGIRESDPQRLLDTHDLALRTGTIVTAVEIDSELALVHLCRSEYRLAEQRAKRSEETARQLGLDEHRLVAVGLRLCVAAHQGDDGRAEALLAEYRHLGGERSDCLATVWGFGLAYRALLAEDREGALAEITRAVREEKLRTPQYFSPNRGLYVFLRTLARRAGWPEHDAVASGVHGKTRWNDQFLLLARAALHGRQGQRDTAADLVDGFHEVSSPYPLSRHLGLRLIAECAVEDGWGDPTSWLRTAEQYFHLFPAPKVAATARAWLRKAGAQPLQRRAGASAIPLPLRGLGVTVREYEVLVLVAQRLSNKEIGKQLVLSPRTVEKHVAGLLAKTSQSDRIALARFAATVMRPNP